MTLNYLDRFWIVQTMSVIKSDPKFTKHPSSNRHTILLREFQVTILEVYFYRSIFYIRKFKRWKLESRIGPIIVEVIEQNIRKRNSIWARWSTPSLCCFWKFLYNCPERWIFLSEWVDWCWRNREFNRQ